MNQEVSYGKAPESEESYLKCTLPMAKSSKPVTELCTMLSYEVMGAVLGKVQASFQAQFRDNLTLRLSCHEWYKVSHV